MVAVFPTIATVVVGGPLGSTVLVDVDDRYGSSLRDDIGLVFDDGLALDVTMLVATMWHCRRRQGQGEGGNDAELHGTGDARKG